MQNKGFHINKPNTDSEWKGQHFKAEEVKPAWLLDRVGTMAEYKTMEVLRERVITRVSVKHITNLKINQLKIISKKLKHMEKVLSIF